MPLTWNHLQTLQSSHAQATAEDVLRAVPWSSWEGGGESLP